MANSGKGKSQKNRAMPLKMSKGGRPKKRKK